MLYIEIIEIISVEMTTKCAINLKDFKEMKLEGNISLWSNDKFTLKSQRNDN